ncbi:MAG: DMT family transporter [Saprospiraceae bacterium]
MQDKAKAFINLHISVFLFGFTAILGDLISINFISVVWWRSFLTFIIFLFIIRIGVLFKSLPRKNIIQQFIIGIFLGVHWLGFYGSIKVSNPTMALIALSSSSLMTALIEPILNKNIKWKKVDIILGLAIVPGFILIFYHTSSIQQKGLWIGLLATFLGVIFSILNKKWLVIGQELKLTFIQMTAVWILLGILFIFPVFHFEIPKGIDWLYFFIFTAFCTVLSYYLYLKAMNFLNAFDVSLAFNMEPIYGIFVAAFLLHDYKDISVFVYLGMLFIFTIVFLDTYIKLKKH